MPIVKRKDHADEPKQPPADIPPVIVGDSPWSTAKPDEFDGARFGTWRFHRDPMTGQLVGIAQPKRTTP